jgi:peptide/nickel transport system permease protein
VARFVVRRLLQLVPILIGLSILVFAFVRALPGDPATALLGERATPAAVAEVRKAYGLDRPLHEQYLTYVGEVAKGDLGQSIQTQQPVVDELKRRFPATVELSLAALLFAVGLGVPLGFWTAKRHGRAVDHLSMAGSLLGISVPVFFLAYMLKFVFGVKLGWFPTVGRLDLTRTLEHPTGFYTLDALIAGDLGAFWDALKHLVLPGIALGTIPLAIVVRITRASVLEVVNEDYVRTARAKGMSTAVVDRRHVLRNALLPITTVIGLQTGLLLSGAVLTEIVFAWGGMGSFMYDAIFTRDFPVIQGGILFLAVVFVLVNLLVDIGYGLLDPRIRVS